MREKLPRNENSSCSSTSKFRAQMVSGVEVTNFGLLVFFVCALIFVFVLFVFEIIRHSTLTHGYSVSFVIKYLKQSGQ